MQRWILGKSEYNTQTAFTYTIFYNKHTKPREIHTYLYILCTTSAKLLFRGSANLSEGIKMYENSIGEFVNILDNLQTFFESLKSLHED